VREAPNPRLLYVSLCMVCMIGMIKKTITIRDDQAEWIRKNHINFSRLIQDKLDEEMKKHK